MVDNNIQLDIMYFLLSAHPAVISQIFFEKYLFIFLFLTLFKISTYLSINWKFLEICRNVLCSENAKKKFHFSNQQ